VQQATTLEAAGSVARKALAGLLALLLLAATTLSVNHVLHQTLHQNDSSNHHLCLLCSFAKGQVSLTEVPFVSAALFLFILLGVRPADFIFLAGRDYRLSPSRAPPGR
jgi:hypothetical protein